MHVRTKFDNGDLGSGLELALNSRSFMPLIESAQINITDTTSWTQS